jgi:hypothetical protein
VPRSSIRQDFTRELEACGVTWPRRLCERAAERLAHQLTLRKDSNVKRGHTQLSAALQQHRLPTVEIWSNDQKVSPSLLLTTETVDSAFMQQRPWEPTSTLPFRKSLSWYRDGLGPKDSVGRRYKPSHSLQKYMAPPSSFACAYPKRKRVYYPTFAVELRLKD